MLAVTEKQNQYLEVVTYKLSPSTITRRGLATASVWKLK
jgi:hypothetical protein